MTMIFDSYIHTYTHTVDQELHPQKQVYFVNEVGVWINMGNIIQHNSLRDEMIIE